MFSNALVQQNSREICIFRHGIIHDLHSKKEKNKKIKNCLYILVKLNFSLMYLVCFSMNSVIIFFASMCQCSQVCVHLDGILTVISVSVCVLRNWQ